MLTFNVDTVLKKLLNLNLTQFFSWLWKCGTRIVRCFVKWFYGMKFGRIHREVSERKIEEMSPMMDMLLQELADAERKETELVVKQSQAAVNVDNFEALAGCEDLVEEAAEHLAEVSAQREAQAQLVESLRAAAEERKRLDGERRLREEAEAQHKRDLDLMNKLNARAREIEAIHDHKAAVEDCLEVAVFENEQANLKQVNLVRVKTDKETGAESSSYDKAIKTVKKGMEDALFSRAIDMIRCRHNVPSEDFGVIDEMARRATLLDFCGKFNLDTRTTALVVRYCLGLSCVPAEWEIDNIVTAHCEESRARRALVGDLRMMPAPARNPVF